MVITHRESVQVNDHWDQCGCGTVALPLRADIVGIGLEPGKGARSRSLAELGDSQ